MVIHENKTYIAVNFTCIYFENFSFSVSIRGIEKKVEELQDDLKVHKEEARNARQKIDKMSAEVVDSNPYSRLMALQ